MSKIRLKPKIYTVATAHLDTSWHWDIETSIREYLPATCEKNFELFEKYPEYIFNFEGAYRYELIEEYYPEHFMRLSEYVKAGRWYPAGSAYENGDTNIPSPEALFRNILYGSDYFTRKFGTQQHELFLPDCFGFSYALPSVARHAGLCGFSTQKLPWAYAYGIPFDLGKWYGVDGKFIYASPDCMNYDFSFKRSVRGYHHIKTKLTENTRRFNMPYAEIYHGIGDRGGAPREQSVETVCREMRRNASAKSDVVSARADEIFLDLDALPRDIKSNLPVWKNELIATDHGTGCYTARSCGKRWNRRAEQLLSIAESFSLAASLAGEYDFRDSVINTAFKRVIAHQFHDDITGTGAMACSRRAWNDYAVSHAQLQNEIYASAGALSRILDTSFCTGIPLVVGSFSGVSGRRREVVRTEIECGNTENVCVYDAQENRIPCSFSRLTDTKHLLVFSADIPACGCAVFDVRPEAPRQVFKALSITKNSLENDYIKVLTDENGDICSIFDKQNSREALASPIRFLLTDFTGVANYPAWELEYGEVIKTPDAYPASPRVRIAEATPACAALEIKRSFKGSEFTQTVSLGRNSRRVDVCCEIDWRTPRSLLRVNFPFTVKSSEASYDLGLGVIKRKNSCKRLYEFPAQNWADITDEDGSYGVSVLSDSRTGWEKMTDNSLNLTAIFSPKASRGDSCSQQLLDFGLNRFSYSLLPHSGNAGAYTQREGAFFNSPVFAFETDRHEGKTREISFFNLKSENVAVRAFKKALNSDDIVVRFNELCGCGASVRFSLNDSLPGFKLISAHEANARELIIGDAALEGDALVFDLEPYAVKTFLLKCSRCKTSTDTQTAVPLPYNLRISSRQGENITGALKDGLCVPEELIPGCVESGETVFTVKKEGKNAVRCEGQIIDLPPGAARISLLAASGKGDSTAVFTLGSHEIKKTVPDMLEAFAKWDMLAAGETGYVKCGIPALVFTHMHGENGDEIGRQCMFFNIELDVPNGARALVLPDDNEIFVLSASFASRPKAARPAIRLCETLERRECDFVYTDEEKSKSISSKSEQKRCKRKSDLRYAEIRLTRELARFRK